MKIFLPFFLLISSWACIAQPTGHQKIFFVITDQGDTLHFEHQFRNMEFGSIPNLTYKNYQLSDISTNRTGFEFYPPDEYIHKTLMTHDHRIQIVRNSRDTMEIEILNAFNVYFLSIPFQIGKFRMIVNDGKDNQWYLNTLPYKLMTWNGTVYNITPKVWDDFAVDWTSSNRDYSISTIFKKQNLLAEPVLPEDDPNFLNPRRISTLRVEVGDYNFDGQKDYREHKWNNPKEWNYFIYTDSITGFVLDSFMSQIEITKFDLDKKTFDVLRSGTSKEESTQIDTYEFVNGKPSLINKQPPTNTAIIDARKEQQDTFTTSQSILIHPFRFVLERNTPGVDLPTEIGYYANKISVYKAQTNTLIFETVAVGNFLKQSAGCSDSLQIADYNFDGYPDFRICHSIAKGKHTYYIYHQQRDTFLIEHTLTQLQDVAFDFDNKMVTGTTNKKKYAGYPADHPGQYYMETLLFEGSALKNLTVTTTNYVGMPATIDKCTYINQKRIYEGDSIGWKLLSKNQLIRNAGPFRFVIDFNQEDYATSGEKGAYVKLIKIFEGKRIVGNFEMHGNYFQEVPHWLDSLEIADFNFDGYPDMRMYNSQINNTSYSYFLYNPNKEVQQFYVEGLFSGLIESEFIPSRKILKGKIIEANQTLYIYLKNDTLTLTKQDNDRSKQPFIEESIYRYGNRKTIRVDYGSLEPQLKREYGDYNFDGYEDFRQQSKEGPYQWDVFMYNPRKESFEKDTLLSKFDNFSYDHLDKKLEGYYTSRDDETTRSTYYYQWSFAKQKMVLYQEKVCSYKFPGSESSRCTVSRLVNGTWIVTEQFGAE
jgi:hypothetical protein